MNKRLHSDLSIEELLKSIESTEETSNQFPNDVVRFLVTLNIVPGDEIIKKNVLFSIYKAWSKTPLKQQDFFKIISDYIPNKDNGSIYLINTNAAKLTHEAYLKFKKNNKMLSSPNWQKHYKAFLDYNALHSGNSWIHENDLYLIYNKYRKEAGLLNINSFLTFEKFMLFSDIYFPIKNTETGKLYGLSDNIQLLLTQARAENEKEEKTDKTK